jgi:hypothetical protein
LQERVQLLQPFQRQDGEVQRGRPRGSIGLRGAALGFGALALVAAARRPRVTGRHPGGSEHRGDGPDGLDPGRPIGGGVYDHD